MIEATMKKNLLDGTDKGAAEERISKILESLGVEAVSDDLKERCLTILMEAEYIVTFLIHDDFVSKSVEADRRIDSKGCVILSLGGQL